MLRLGRFLDSLYSALETIRHPDLVIRVSITLARIADGLYLLADHVIWLSRAGIFRVNLDKWNNTANKYWLMTLTMNLTRDMYEIARILERKRFSWDKTSDNWSRNVALLRHRQDVVLDTIKNLCDIFIPLSALGHTDLSPGVVGLLGVISSALAMYTLLKPQHKLLP